MTRDLYTNQMLSAIYRCISKVIVNLTWINPYANCTTIHYPYANRYGYQRRAVEENNPFRDIIERVTYNIPKNLFKQLRYLAIDKNTTVTALLVEAIKEYLSKV